jgi:lysophospholipase L1-like esterase
MCGREPGCHFIKTSKFFLGIDGRPNDALFLEDRLHLNREGYRLWSRLIKGALDSDLPPLK